MEQVCTPRKGKGRKGNVRNANVTNGGEPTRENEEGLEQEEYGGYHEDWEDSRDVCFSWGGNESPSGLDWGGCWELRGGYRGRAISAKQ